MMMIEINNIINPMSIKEVNCKLQDSDVKIIFLFYLFSVTVRLIESF